MITSVVDAAPLAYAHAEVDDLLGAPLDLWTSDALMDAWRDVERLRNRLAAVEHRFVAAAEARQLPAEFGARNTAAFLRGLLRVDSYEASVRVRAADPAVGRTTLTGEPTPAPFAQVSAAQVSGAISPRHAAVVVKAVERLSDELQVSHGLQVETELTELAGQFDPAELAKLGQRMTMLLDQDGALADVEYRERKREFTVHQRADGSSSVSGEATAELTERLLTLFDALAAPKPAADGVQDARTAAQRRHDALNDALDLVARAELLPDAGGVTATVLLTAKVEGDSGHSVTVSQERNHGSSGPRPTRPSAGSGGRASVRAEEGPPYQARRSRGRFVRSTLPARPHSSPAATPHRPGAKPPTSKTTHEADPPPPATACCSAATTTATTRNSAGDPSARTAHPPGSPHPGSIRAKNHAGIAESERRDEMSRTSEGAPPTASRRAACV